jgi:hypothetical protein
MDVISALVQRSPMLILGLVAVACASASTETRSITVAESESGAGVVVAVSEALAREVLESAIGSELSCQGEIDQEFESLLRTLDDRGRGSRATIVYDDGVLVAHRTRRSLELEFRDRDGGGIDAVLPWTVAECMLGRTTRVSADVAEVRVTIRGEDGGSFEFRVD